MRTVVLAAVLVLAAVPALAATPIGVITELHLRNGQVEVKPAAGGDWQAAQPLLSINEGDQVRAAGAGRAVLVFVASQRSTVVTPANSPFVVAPPAQPGFGERVKAAVGFLQSTPVKPQSLQTRSTGEPVVLLAPRTLVAAEGVTLEWTGRGTSRYTVRVISGDGRVLFERKALEAQPLALSPDDVRLVPGRYRWEVESQAHGIHHAAFDVATPDAVAQAGAAADAVEQARYPAVTAALLKAAALSRERFHAAARRELLRAIAASPDEPTLHVVLADVYDKTGLPHLGDAERSRAGALSAGQ